MEDTKKCPYCGGEIKAVAKKCKHCGEWLETESSAETTMLSSSNRKLKIYLFVVLAVVIIGGGVVWLFTGHTERKQENPTDIFTKDSLQCLVLLDSIRKECANADKVVNRYKNSTDMSLERYNKLDRAFFEQVDIYSDYESNQQLLEQFPILRAKFSDRIANDSTAISEYREYLSNLSEKLNCLVRIRKFRELPHSTIGQYDAYKESFENFDVTVEQMNDRLGLSSDEKRKERKERLELRLSYLNDIIAGKFGTMQMQDRAVAEKEDIQVLLDIMN